MNDDILAFSLEYEEAVELDELFLQAKSFKKQIEVMHVLVERPEHHQLYYINTLVEELIKAKKYDELNKYLKTVIKEVTDVSLLMVWLKVLFMDRHNISEYGLFKRTCLGIFMKESIDYENLLLGYIDV